MKLAFTGTRTGMTARQGIALRELLIRLQPTELHHGDGDGADQQAHHQAEILPSCVAIAHPPALKIAMEYLKRNREVVDAGRDGLIATPRFSEEERRSGTWATVRYARKLGRLIWIIWPDGTITEEEKG